MKQRTGLAEDCERTLGTFEMGRREVLFATNDRGRVTVVRVAIFRALLR